LDILGAIRFATQSWDEVSTHTIINCWKHTKLAVDSECELVDTDYVSSEMKEIYEAINHLKPLNPMSVVQFVNHEDELIIEDMLDDDAILVTLFDEDTVVSDDEVEYEMYEKKITNSDALKSFEVLRNYLEQQEDDVNEELKSLRFIKNVIDFNAKKTMKQSSILSFFKPMNID
jgi:hypothetical protein